MAPVVSHLTIDCADPRALARWWREVLDWTYLWDSEDDEEEVEIGPADGSSTPWLFLKVPDVKTVKNRLHADLRPPNGSDQATELERLLALGATRVDIGQQDVPWHVLADPEGNEFCLLRSTPDQVAAILAGS
jgi:hypothetical protein